MRLIMAMYIPHPERAVGPALIQLAMLAVLAGALYAYLRPRCGRRATVKALLVGEVVSFVPLVPVMVIGLGDTGNMWRHWGADYSDWVLILTEHFELFGFGISSFICLLVAAMILYSLKAGKRRCTPGDKAGALPDSPDSDGMVN